MRRASFAILLLAQCLDAAAYCVRNELPDREVFVEQEPHPEKLREDRILRLTLKPGQSHCCRNLDCNPGGRDESIVGLSVTILGEPRYSCAYDGEYAKVTGDGTLRVLRNPRKSANPYVVRVRARNKDLTGPRGVPCTELKAKGKP